MNPTDGQLLQRYFQDGSEGAFEELVRRHINLVYSAALRQANGDTHVAEDVTQLVFAKAARSARRLAANASLAAWLYTTTRFIASGLRRSEQRRRAREHEVHTVNAILSSPEPPSDWPRIYPLLDEAMHALEGREREAVLLRHFENLSFAEIGAALGLSENAARMRVTRALDKLRSLLNRRGVALSAAALGAALTGEAVTAAPAGLAATVAGAAIAVAAAGTGASTTLLKLIPMTMTKLKLSLVGAIVVAGLGASMVAQNREQTRLREANELLRQRGVELASEIESLSNQLAQASSPLPDDQRLELLRLRGEVGVLKRQLAEAPKAPAPAPLPAAVPPVDPAARQKEAIIERTLDIGKMTQLNEWMYAFDRYQDKNNGQWPATFEQAAPYFRNTNDSATLAAADFYQVVYQGTMAGSTNWGATIMVRETDPVQHLDGQWARAYGFADGHSMIALSSDGNFQSFESQYVTARVTGANSSP